MTVGTDVTGEGGASQRAAELSDDELERARARRFRVRLGGTSGTVVGMCEYSFASGAWYWNGVLRPVVYCRTRASGGQIRYSSFSEQVSGAGSSIGSVLTGSVQGVLQDIGDAPLNTTVDQALVLSYEVVGTTPGDGTIDLKYWAIETLM